jgi:electron transport complex protein RnfC
MVIMGGPLMGFTLPWLDVPVVKITNCLLAPSASEMGEPEEEKGCIRCSACADACPADLLPQQLYWFSKGQQHDKATSHNLADCIECGACAWVCPQYSAGAVLPPGESRDSAIASGRETRRGGQSPL